MNGNRNLSLLHSFKPTGSVGTPGGGVGSRKYRVAFVVEPHEAETRRLARHPGIVDLTKVTEEVAQVARLCFGGQVADEHLAAGQSGKEATFDKQERENHVEHLHAYQRPPGVLRAIGRPIRISTPHRT